ncbi:MAG: histidine kinase dimerization/phospho-acceptor domain-containing protein, partial [Bacteroidota bacterium]
MHWLLEKQLRLSGLSEDDIPDQLSDVFSHIGRTYGQVDQERHLLGMLLTGASDDLLNMYTVLQDVEGRPSWIDGWTRRIAEQLHDMSGAVTPVEPDAREKANTYAWSLLADLERPLTTPATDILGFASILQEEGTDEVKEYAHIIHYSAGRMLELVKSVIDLALLETDRLGGDDELLDVTDYLQQTVRTLDPVLQRRGLELAVVPTHAPVRVRLERGYLSRLLRNFTNALMHVYRLDGRLPLEVRMSGDTVEVRAVGDEGSLNLDRWRAWEEGDDEQLPPELRLGLTLVQRMAHPAGGAIDVVREGDDVILRLALPAVEDGPTPEIVTQPEE